MAALAYKVETDTTKISTKELHKMMLSIGVPPNISGYSYIVYALDLIMQDPSCIQCITKGLYLDVAKHFNTKPSQVERGMRHAIQSTWICGDRKLLDEIFKNCIKPNKVTPTNTIFLARLYYYITNREDVK